MNRENASHILAGSLAISLITSSCFGTSLSAHKQTNNPPNLVVILTDDQGYSDVGCYGAKDFTTPNLDRMAKEGVRFTDFYAAATCSPARASLLTGSYAQRVGIETPLNGLSIGLHPEEITIAEHLKKQGYATACIGTIKSLSSSTCHIPRFTRKFYLPLNSQGEQSVGVTVTPAKNWIGLLEKY